MAKKRPRTLTEAADDEEKDFLDDEDGGALAVTVDDGGRALDCGVCYLPLRPPIFQCINGHVLCCPCRNKLMATGNGKCHVCRAAMGTYDRRCHAMEMVAVSTRVPCPRAAHSCTAMPTYYDRSSHCKVCPHARYSCSHRGCGFIGMAGALLHIATVHSDGNNARMQQFWTQELSRMIHRLKLGMAADDIGMGVWPHDVQVVMTQAGVPMDKAAMALKASHGNTVEAIRKLSTDTMIRPPIR